MRRFRHHHKIIRLLCLFMLSAGSAYCSAGSTVLEQEQLRLKYSLAQGEIGDSRYLALSDAMRAGPPSGVDSERSYKSPIKAFVLSLVVPGLGQYYYGSRIKPFVFLGAEIAAWAYYFKWHGEGGDITAEFEAFNRQHWVRMRYEDYLFYVYGVRDDDSVPSSATEVSHHLPDELSQQYYEMTGKYDQFAWGWDDARLNGQDLGPGVLAITGPATVPYSANRLYYEGRRNAANDAFDKATRMVFVSMANRLISAFEALYRTRSLNNKARRSSPEFGNIRLKAALKSYHSSKDTPFFTVTYKF